MVPYLVSRFSRHTLSNLVKECFGDDFPDILQKNQIGYIYRYLKDLGAKSILLEFDYVDKDYLEDFARYYVKRFSNAGHKCARLHFFANEVHHTTLNDILLGDNRKDRVEKLNQAYLGFMVIKPLPKTFIGKTCLKLYPDEEGKAPRKLLSRTYHVNLFGIPLSIDTIAFQEQDKVVSACATAAIWTALNTIKVRSVREIPACSEITMNAINFIDGSSNSFPSKELTNKQMLRALDVANLRHHSEPLANSTREEFMLAVRCSIDSELPLIVGADVYAIGKDNCLSKRAGHAVTILGYRSGGQEPVIYLHDDRVGPFARARFIALSDYKTDASSGTNQSEKMEAWGLTLENKDDNGNWAPPHEILVVDSSIVPTHQKVRLPSMYARQTCDHIRSEYNKLLGRSREQNLPKEGLRFDLKLYEISILRQEILDNKIVLTCDNNGQPLTLSAYETDRLKEQKVAFLTKSMARFQWVGNFYFSDVLLFRVLFDATDIPQGDAVSAVYIEHQMYAGGVINYFKKVGDAATLDPVIESKRFYTSFLKRLKEPQGDLMVHLEKTYGGLRAPRYLKKDEIVDNDVKQNALTPRLYEAIEEPLENFLKFASETAIKPLIWAVTHDGGLVVGTDSLTEGHPCITGMKPARIAGELHRTKQGWEINCSSGRYSRDYHDADVFLTNALKKFKMLFPASAQSITIQRKKATASA